MCNLSQANTQNYQLRVQFAIINVLFTMFYYQRFNIILHKPIVLYNTGKRQNIYFHRYFTVWIKVYHTGSWPATSTACACTSLNNVWVGWICDWEIRCHSPTSNNRSTSGFGHRSITTCSICKQEQTTLSTITNTIQNKSWNKLLIQAGEDWHLQACLLCPCCGRSVDNPLLHPDLQHMPNPSLVLSYVGWQASGGTKSHR